MVKVITVEREYGSGGADFAHRLADHIGWRLIDRCVIDEIAREAHVSESVVAECDERLDPWYHRIGKSFWYGSVEHLPALPKDEVFDSERMVALVREYLKGLAGSGNCVILGRGAACALAPVPGVFNLFVYASMTRKIRWFEEQFPEHAAEARHELEATDGRRANYIKRYYDQNWTDHRLYHLMINSCMGNDAMIAATLESAGLAALRHPK